MLTFGLLGDPGHTATSTVTVHVTPTAPVPSDVTKLPAAPFNASVAGTGGVIYQTTVGGDVTNGYRTYVTIVRPNGTSTTVSQPGQTYSGVVVGPNGTAYQVSSTGVPGSIDYTNATTTLQAIRQDGSVVAYTQPGVIDAPDAVVVGPDGSVYVNSTAGSANPGYTTVVRIVRPDGTTTTHTQLGDARYSVVVAPDGTAYQTSAVYEIDLTKTTIVDVLSTNGTTTEYKVKGGLPDGPIVVGSDGTAYQTTSLWDEAVGTFTNTITAIHTDGTSTARSSTLGVRPTIVVAPNGTAYETSALNGTSLTVVQPGGSSTTRNFDGSPVGGVLLAADGNASYSNGVTTITAVHPDGTARVHPLSNRHAHFQSCSRGRRQRVRDHLRRSHRDHGVARLQARRHGRRLQPGRPAGRASAGPLGWVGLPDHRDR
jgi:hypothetical protein